MMYALFTRGTKCYQMVCLSGASERFLGSQLFLGASHAQHFQFRIKAELDPDLCKCFGTFQGRAEELRVAQERTCDEENVFSFFS